MSHMYRLRTASVGCAASARQIGRSDTPVAIMHICDHSQQRGRPVAMQAGSLRQLQPSSRSTGRRAAAKALPSGRGRGRLRSQCRCGRPPPLCRPRLWRRCRHRQDLQQQRWQQHSVGPAGLLLSDLGGSSWSSWPQRQEPQWPCTAERELCSHARHLWHLPRRRCKVRPLDCSRCLPLCSCQRLSLQATSLWPLTLTLQAHLPTSTCRRIVHAKWVLQEEWLLGRLPGGTGRLLLCEAPDACGGGSPGQREQTGGGDAAALAVPPAVAGAKWSQQASEGCVPAVSHRWLLYSISLHTGAALTEYRL